MTKILVAYITECSLVEVKIYIRNTLAAVINLLADTSRSITKLQTVSIQHLLLSRSFFRKSRPRVIFLQFSLITPTLRRMAQGVNNAPDFIKREESPTPLPLRSVPLRDDRTHYAAKPTIDTIWVNSVSILEITLPKVFVSNCPISVSYAHDATKPNHDGRQHTISASILQFLLKPEDNRFARWAESDEAVYVSLEFRLNNKSQHPVFTTRHRLISDDHCGVVFVHALDWAQNLVDHVDGLARAQETARLAAQHQAAQREQQQATRSCCAPSMTTTMAQCRCDTATRWGSPPHPMMAMWAMAMMMRHQSHHNNINDVNNAGRFPERRPIRQRRNQAASREGQWSPTSCEDEQKQHKRQMCAQLMESYRLHAESRFMNSGDTQQLLQVMQWAANRGGGGGGASRPLPRGARVGVGGGGISKLNRKRSLSSRGSS
ncbi:hypothetical protein B0H63DRAFT_200730 [Podospora didyma]|uniref:Uncharacterized protein n=1 Tax=Podospora didyma TaxID=330526 RepID=A0AAE0NH25_9PEZI|nr:hypothetical protein B0H63DRAFT_200730 [Podospora didyma]